MAMFIRPVIAATFAIIEGIAEWQNAANDKMDLVDLNAQMESELLSVLTSMELAIEMPETLADLYWSDAWLLQAVADMANVSAKTISADFYDLKDWCLGALTERFPETMEVGYSLGYPEVVVSTSEWGVSSYHCPYVWNDRWNGLPPISRSWSGIRRQFSSLQIAANEMLLRVVAYATHVATGPRHPLAIRVNNLLGAMNAPKPQLP